MDRLKACYELPERGFNLPPQILGVLSVTVHTLQKHANDGISTAH